MIDLEREVLAEGGTRKRELNRKRKVIPNSYKMKRWSTSWNLYSFLIYYSLWSLTYRLAFSNTLCKSVSLAPKSAEAMHLCIPMTNAVVVVYAKADATTRASL